LLVGDLLVLNLQLRIKLADKLVLLGEVVVQESVGFSLLLVVDRLRGDELVLVGDLVLERLDLLVGGLQLGRFLGELVAGDRELALDLVVRLRTLGDLGILLGACLDGCLQLVVQRLGLGLGLLKLDLELGVVVGQNSDLVEFLGVLGGEALDQFVLLAELLLIGLDLLLLELGLILRLAQLIFLGLSLALEAADLVVASGDLLVEGLVLLEGLRELLLENIRLAFCLVEAELGLHHVSVCLHL